MARSTPKLPDDRLAIGQLLARLQHHFRVDLFDDPKQNELFPEIRFPHLQVWGNVGIDGIRLTDLADKANMGLPAMSELVDELQDLGYLERRPDPDDGRAKLIFPTKRGRALLNEAGRAVAELEARWRAALGPGEFDAACRALDRLLRTLDETPLS